MPGVTDLLIDEDYDLVFQNGDFVRVNGPDACAQLIRIVCQVILGELLWDERVGNAVLAAEESPTPLEVKQEHRRLITAVPGVQSLGALDLTVDPLTRVANLDGEAIYEDGTPIKIKESIRVGGL